MNQNCSKQELLEFMHEMEQRNTTFLDKYENIQQEAKLKIEAVRHEIKNKAIELFNIIINQQNKLMNESDQLEKDLSRTFDQLILKQQQTESKLKDYQQRLDSYQLMDQNELVRLKFELEQIKFDLFYHTNELNKIYCDYEFKPNNLIQHNLTIGRISEQSQKLALNKSFNKRIKFESDPTTTWWKPDLHEKEPSILSTLLTAGNVITIEIKTENELDKSIWKTMVNESPGAGVKKSEMTPKQLDVYYCLNNLMKEVISTNYGHKTRSNLIRKTLTGYTVRRFCWTINCSAAWTLHINVPSGDGTIQCVNKCEHLNDERIHDKDCKGKKKLLDIKFEAPLSIDIWGSLNNKSSCLNKFEMTAAQRTEAERLDEFMNRKILSYGFKTNLNTIRKSATGYTVRRLCNQNYQPCTAAWIMQVNVPNGDGGIYFNTKCNHITF